MKGGDIDGGHRHGENATKCVGRYCHDAVFEEEELFIVSIIAKKKEDTYKQAPKA